jgi:hypothetical protein
MPARRHDDFGGAAHAVAGLSEEADEADCVGFASADRLFPPYCEQ